MNFQKSHDKVGFWLEMDLVNGIEPACCLPAVRQGRQAADQLITNWLTFFIYLLK
jgi:hypothetical protein